MATLILPVFNVAAYLRECLQSIVEQDFSQTFEAILIDDCSTDGSAGICREFVARYPGIFILIECETNSGASAARNIGLDRAIGKYLMFVDPDDILPEQALKLLVEAAERHATDIVKGNNTIFDEHRERPANYNASRQALLRGERVLTTLYQHDRVRGHPWGKLFRRDKLGAYRFPQSTRMAEDLFYCCEVFSHADSLLLINRNIYRYRDRDSGSTGRKFKSGSYLDWLNSVENTVQFARTPAQRRAHRSLLLRTMTQLARECRGLAPEESEAVLSVIETRCESLKIRFWQLIFKDRLGLRSLLRYLKMRLAIRQTRNNLLHAA